MMRPFPRMALAGMNGTMAQTPQRPPPPAERQQGPVPPFPDTALPPLNETPGRAPGARGSLVLEAGEMPVDGYLLEERLGRGGFGEVWRALGPGGFRVAMKFITLDDRAGRLEKRSLELMKAIQHPHLLAMFGAWERHGSLIIAMELGRCTLLQRLNDALDQGWLGVPPTELLEYMREAAKGIDYLNEPVHKLGDSATQGIQHRDIKPQNLLLVGSGLKVADFGLAKLLEQSIMEVSGSMTPAYAAPEQFNGQASRWSDQYSLAVSYCHLRGNALPFTGSAAQVVAGHLTKNPDLTMLPEAERPVVARALAKEPTKRWPSCKAFVDALAEAMQSKKGHAEPAPRPAPVKESGVQFKVAEEEYHRFPCPQCKQLLKVKTAQLNKRMRCVHCQAIIQSDLPGPAAPVPRAVSPAAGVRLPTAPQRLPIPPDHLPIAPEELPPPRNRLTRFVWGLLSFVIGLLVIAASAALTLLLLWAVYSWWRYGVWPGKN